MSIRASVVVPTFRRPDLLRRCLAALVIQDFSPFEYEIIVADDGTSEETRAVVEEFCTCRSPEEPAPCVRYVPVEGAHGPAAARNRGWQAARGQIIAFTDDDCVPTTGWLQAGVEAFTDGVVGVTGRVRVPLSPYPTDYELNAAGLERSEFVTASCFYRRDVLCAVGGFDERFRAAWREDTDLYFTLLRLGCRLGRAENALVIHPVRRAPWGVSLRQQRKSMFNALLYKKHPELYRERLEPPPPHYYATVGAAGLAAAGMLLGNRATALMGAAAWTGLTTRFCARRLHGTSPSWSHVLEMMITSILIPPLSVFWRLRGAAKYKVLFF